MIKYFYGTLVLVALASCSTPKVSYFKDVEPGVVHSITQPVEVRLRPGDKLSILVNSKDMQMVNLFNLPVSQRLMGSVGGASTAYGVSAYTVDAAGNIDFPVVGEIKVQGLTRAGVASHIKSLLIKQNLVKDPVVTVEYVNLAISVIGEVNRPGRFNLDKDYTTLLEAIGMAGDLTVYGLRENIKVQRVENGQVKVYTVDLNSGAALYASPVFYLQQGDIVYVEPNDVRARQSTVNGNNIRSASFWISIASLLSTLTTTFSIFYLRK